MSLLKCTLAAVLLSVLPALADDAPQPRPIGVWEPALANTSFSDRTILVFSDAGRFAAFLAAEPETTAAISGNGNVAPLAVSASGSASPASVVTFDRLYAGSGTWFIGESGGEVVLSFDSHSTNERPGSTLYVQMLFLGDELHPYPGMASRSPIAETSWRRVD